MSEVKPGRDPVVETSLRPRMWWLTWFRGFRVVSLHRVPKQNAFGEIYYKNQWILSKWTNEDGRF